MPVRRAVLLVLLLAVLGARATGEEPSGDRRVVLVLVGGGVSHVDMTDPDRMPWLARSASVQLRLTGAARRPHAGAIEVLTGRETAETTGGHPRPAHPTLMERVRDGLDLPAAKVWFVSYEGDEALRLAWSTDARHGRAAEPSVCTAEGAFGAPLVPLLQSLGRPLPAGDATWRLVQGLRRLGQETAAARLPASVDAASSASLRVERALLAEIDRRSALLEGRDLRALRAAGTVDAVHRPRLTVVRLGDLTLVRDAAQRAPQLAALDRGLASLASQLEAGGEAGEAAVLLVVGEPYHPGGERTGEGPALGFAVVGGRWKGPRAGKGRLVDVAPTVLALLGLEDASGTGTPRLRPRGR